MTWDDVLTRLRMAGLHPVEETFMENYGKVLASQRPTFEGRSFRCTYGAARVDGVRIEVLLFPSEFHLNEFVDVIGVDSSRFVVENAILEFPECEPAIVARVVSALQTIPS